MILLDISGASAIVRKQDILTSGMVGANVVFCFDEDWESLAKTAVFRAGKVIKDAIVVDSVSEIPHEVLAAPGVPLEIGVYGTADDGSLVIPTVWARTNTIKTGTDPSGDESLDPSLPIWAQMQEQLNSMYRSSEEINAAKEEMLQAIEEGKEDINATVAAGGYYTKNESGTKFASAINGELSGAIVAANDVSPVEHTVAVKAHGKNLIPPFTKDTSYTSGGVTQVCRLGEQTVTLNGTCTSGGGRNGMKTASGVIQLKAGKTYTLSAFLVSGTVDGTFTVNVSNDADGTSVLSTKLDRTAHTRAITENIKCYIGVNAYIDSVYTDAVIAFQLEESITYSEYTPYIDPTTIKVTRYGADETDNPETYTPNADGTVEGVTSLSPTMTLLTGTAGATLDVEYIRDSNVVIAELLEKVTPAARITSVSLPASKWVGSGTLYSQVVTIDGITENSQVNLTPSVEQLSIFYEKDLTFVTENDGGVVTIYVIGQKPQNDYTIQANIVEVIV